MQGVEQGRMPRCTTPPADRAADETLYPEGETQVGVRERGSLIACIVLKILGRQSS
jgi:hypothetical protein